MIAVRVSSAGRVECACSLWLPHSTEDAWSRFGDPRVSGRVEWVHDRLILHGTVKQGVLLDIPHRLRWLPGWRTHRTGRLSIYRPPHEYAFSDLDDRHPGSRFPHVYRFRLLPRSHGCLLRLEVTGRWTARRVPRPIVWAYLWLVMAKCHPSLLQLAFARHSKSLDNTSPAPTPPPQLH